MKKVIVASVAALIIASSSAYSFPSIPKFGKKNAEAKQAELAARRTPEGFDPVVIPSPNTRGRIKKTPAPDVIGDTRKFTSVTKISVPMYTISFDKKAGESASASSFSGDVNAHAHVHAKLAGVDEDTFARITNQAYTDFEVKLTAAGYDLVDLKALNNTAAYATWQGDKFPKVKKKWSKYLPDGMRYPGKITYGLKWGKLMNETQAAIIQPDLAVNFAAFGTETGTHVNFNKSKASASVSMGPSVHVIGTANGTTLNKCDKRGQCFGDMIALRLGQATYSEKPFGSILDTTHTAVKVTQGALKVLGALSGSSTSRTDAEKTLTADAKAYEAAALDALFQANSRIVNKLKAADKVK